MRPGGKISGLLPAFLLAAGVAGCRPCSGDLQQEERLKALYAERMDSPSEYRAKMVEDPYWVRRREQLLGGTLPMERKALRQAVRRLEEEIRQGRRWHSPVRTAKIPFAVHPPVIDGVMEEHEWRNALVYQGEYPLSSETSCSSQAEWRLQYDREFLYFAVRIFDAAVIPGPADAPYKGDSVELFLLPDFRLAAYLETVVSTTGKLYTAWATQSRLRHYDLQVCRVPDAEAKVHLFPGGYTVELKIPFSGLPGYLLGNPPRKGETMNFMMIRCNLDADGSYTRTTPVPFLYDGHNIYGYIRGVLD